ncbi:hypothetical protein Adi01nite_62160 [Amorphoplanes digitatis]|uniref:murein transglycosylase n=1 Tax=Actinoplanes digitatis TaxID=1868 RepID=UPI0019436BF8|nr:murein transglycosylase [Actinoplanes digitatis]GID96804.1 hypothetical protein Adi01nite_62160 [Actinoplanes digitatis]
MTDGQETPSARRGRRPSAPHLGGPLGSSGAAPADEPPATDSIGDQATADGDRATSVGDRAAKITAGDVTTPVAGSPAAAAKTGAAGDDHAPKAATETKTADGDAAVSGARPETKAEAPAGKDVADGTAAGKADATAAGKADATAAGKADATAAGKDVADATAAGKADATAAGKDVASGTAAGKAGPATAAAAEPGTTANGDDTPKSGPEKTGKDGTGKDGAGETSVAPAAAAVAAAASKGRTTRVLRAANPVRVARNTARSTSAWAKRPSGRLILPAAIAALLLGAAGSAGAYLVPQALQSVPSPSVTPGFGQDAGASAGPITAPSISGVPGLPGSVSTPGGTLPATVPPVAGVGGARPADVLAAWAQEAGTRAGIPVVAVQAYGYAELVVARATPACHLNWTTIAAIAKVESSHGSANGAVLSADGSVAPPIFGLPLDGKGGRQLIRDSDQGALDGDPQFDRAMGPLQFIPQTWTAISVGNGVDADNNGLSDPNDIDDAALAAARYLCQGGRDLSKPDAWWDAILSYNAVRPYAQKVFDAANEYGQRTRV